MSYPLVSPPVVNSSTIPERNHERSQISHRAITMGKPLDPNTRNIIVRCLFHRCSTRDICDTLNVTYQSVKNIEKNLLAYGTPLKPNDLSPKGRPDILSEEAEEALAGRYLKEGKVVGSQKEMVAWLREEWGLQVSQSTVSRLLRRRREGKIGKRREVGRAAAQGAKVEAAQSGPNENDGSGSVRGESEGRYEEDQAADALIGRAEQSGAANNDLLGFREVEGTRKTAKDLVVRPDQPTERANGPTAAQGQQIHDSPYDPQLTAQAAPVANMGGTEDAR